MSTRAEEHPHRPRRRLVSRALERELCQGNIEVVERLAGTPFAAPADIGDLGPLEDDAREEGDR